MPRRNRNATRGAGRREPCRQCHVRSADPYPEPTLEGLCGECADLAVWGALPGDGYADRGTPYSDDELTGWAA